MTSNDGTRLYIGFIDFHGYPLGHGWEVRESEGRGGPVSSAMSVNRVRDINDLELHSMSDINGGWVIFNLEKKFLCHVRFSQILELHFDKTSEYPCALKIFKKITFET